MRFRIPLVAIAAMTTIACEPVAAQSSHPDEIQVSMLRDGSMLVDGRSANLADLEAALDRMKAKGGGHVAYYREAGNETPSPELRAAIMKVLEAVVRNDLPVRMSSKPDFSDSIDDQGRSRPYTPDTKGAQ